MKSLTPAAPLHFGHLGCSLLKARSSASGWDAKWASTKSRALRELLASADQPLRLLPSCFAILPGFAAWERLATINVLNLPGREVDSVPSWPPPGGWLCGQRRKPLPFCAAGEKVQSCYRYMRCTHAHLTPSHLPDMTGVGIDTCMHAHPLCSMTRMSLITEQLQYGQGMDADLALGQGVARGGLERDREEAGHPLVSPA